MTSFTHRVFCGAALLACSCAAEEIALKKTEDGYSFKTAALGVTISERGWISSVEADGTAVLAEDPKSAKLLFDLEEDKKWISKDEKITPVEVTRVDGTTVRSRLRAGVWQVDAFIQLYPEQHQIRRWFELTWRKEEPGKIKYFWFDAGRMPFPGDKGSYLLPGTYPQRRKTPSELREGAKASNWVTPLPALAENASGWTAFWGLNALQPYSDRGNVEVREEQGAIRVVQLLKMQGHVKKGVPQKVGDSWLWLQKTDLESALKNLHVWFGQIGQTVPKDRPEWVKRLILYSMHPGGTIGSDCRDWGGFQNSAKYLPFLRDLGCNGIWLMPLEDLSIYCPRDYYKLQGGIGTTNDFKAFSAKAHALGMKLWQDCVPHGGCNNFSRSLDHPEWLAYQEDGTSLHYWCYDFNWPTWIDYMGRVVSYYTKDFNLDGLRIDAVDGSHIVNWSPKIPYGRASFSQSQGGMAMQRGLRAAVRGVNPNGANLAEAGDSINGVTSDATYDFSLCYNVLHDFFRLPAEEFVPRLRRWLQEQQYAETPDLVRMRHVESHDALRSSLWYGQAAQEATVAMISWIQGFPLVYQEMEDGHFEAYRKIFHIRRCVAELNMGAVDYLAPKVPDGIFACLRTGCVPKRGEAAWCEDYAWDAKSSHGGQGVSVVLINMTGTAQSFTAEIPWGESSRTSCSARDLMTGRNLSVHDGGKFEVSLLPFGHTVVRLESGALPALEPETIAAVPAAKPQGQAAAGDANGLSLVLRKGAWPFQRALPVRVELLGRNGKALQAPYKLAQEETKNGGISVRVADSGGKRPEEVMLAVRMPAAERWFAHTAEGGFEGPFLVRHPSFDGKIGPIYRLWQGGSCFWDSRIHPFGFTKETAEVGAVCGKDAVALSGMRRGADVRLLDRVGEEHGFVAAVCPGSGEVAHETMLVLDVQDAEDVVPQKLVETGDPRLTVVGGGWQFENSFLRVRFQRNGTVRGIWTRKGGVWEQRVESAFGYTDIGYGTEEYKWFDQSSDVETFVRFTKLGEDRIKLAFEGEFRNAQRFAKMRKPVAFRAEYTLGSGKEIGMAFSCNAQAMPEKNIGFLSFKTRVCNAAKAAFTGQDGKKREADRPAKGRYLQSRFSERIAPPSRVFISGADASTCTVSEIAWQGCLPENVFLDGNDLHFAWMDGTIAGPFKPGAWLGFSAKLSVE